MPHPATHLQQVSRHATGALSAADAARAELLAHLEDIERAAAPRQAILLRPADLPAGLPQSMRARFAPLVMNALADTDRLRRFALPDLGDVATWRPRPGRDAAAAIATVLRERLGLPAAAPIPGFASFTLPRELTALRAALYPPAQPAPDASLPPIPPQACAQLIARLPALDLAPFLRRRMIWRLGAPPAPGFAWTGFDTAALAASLAPGFAVDAPPAATRLADALAAPLLRQLSQPGAGAGRDTAIALSLPLAAILSPGFLSFDAALSARRPGQVLVMVNAQEVLAAPGPFRLAQRLLRACGHQLGLLGLTAALLRLLDIAAIDPDLIGASAAAAAQPQCQDLLREAGPPVFLSAVDDFTARHAMAACAASFASGSALP